MCRNFVVPLAIGIISTGMALAEEPRLRLPDNTPHADWCRLDDPAWYRAELYRIGTSSVPDAEPGCPQIRPAGELPDTLILPLACGHAIVFQKVVVDGRTVLDQETIRLGDRPIASSKGLTELARGYRDESIAGAFNQGFGDRKPGSEIDLQHLSGRSYYIGKYEVTDFQYHLFADGMGSSPDCQAAEKRRLGKTFRDVPPARNLGWFDAISFIRRVNASLMASEAARSENGRESLLPREFGMVAYLRLPSEAEWEFAARGGSLASGTDDNPIPPAIDPKTQAPRAALVTEVAGLFAHQSAQAAERGYVPIGMHMPNLVGLYDTLGGVGEIVQDLFRFTRPDGKPHGQVGGYVVRGGGADSSEAMIGYGAREEFPLFSESGERRHPTNGFRLVLSVPVTVEEAQVAPNDQPLLPVAGNTSQPTVSNTLLPAEKRWKLAVQQAVDKALTATGAGSRINAAIQDLQVIRERHGETDKLKERIESVEAKLRAATVELNDADRKLHAEKVRSAILLAHSIQVDGAGLTKDAASGKDLIIQINQSGISTSERKVLERIVNKIREENRENERLLLISFDFYIDSIAKLLNRPLQETLSSVDSAIAEFRRQNLPALVLIGGLVRSNLSELAAANNRLDRQAKRRWLYTLDSSREQRETRSPELR
jgi:formylglycine-generating enzyme required for sulfatase activity